MKKIIIIMAMAFISTSIFAGVIVIPANNGTDLDKATSCANGTPGGFVTLSDIVIYEKSVQSFRAPQNNVTLILTAPMNWQFNPGIGNVSFAPNQEIISASIVVIPSKMTITFSTVYAGGKFDTMKISGIQVQAIDGNLAPCAGNILRCSADSGTAKIRSLFVDATNFGSLSLDSNSPMPVELTSFTVLSEKEGVKLNWNTATEVQNFGFEVERSSTELSMRWEKIGFVKGSGNSNSEKKYSFTDKNLINGKYSYRLKQIDTDGSFKFSMPVEVEFNSMHRKFDIGNFPNPFNPTTIIKFELPEAGHVTLTIYNIAGEKVATLVDEEMNAGVYQRTFSSNSLGRQLSSGIYMYRLATDNGINITKKMILAK
jgi:hypothetical protein